MWIIFGFLAGFLGSLFVSTVSPRLVSTSVEQRIRLFQGHLLFQRMESSNDAPLKLSGGVEVGRLLDIVNNTVGRIERTYQWAQIEVVWY